MEQDSDGLAYSPKVLLVEDDFDEQSLVMKVVKEFDPNIILEAAHTGKEAILILESLAREDLPKLVILDISLPIVSGHEVLKRIRQRPETRMIPVTVFTGSNRKEDRVMSEALHASYVQKPVVYEEYVAVLNSILQYWIKLNRTGYEP